MRVAGMMADQDGNDGSLRQEEQGILLGGHRDPGVQKASSLLTSHACGTWQPRWSLVVVDPPVSHPQGRPNAPAGGGRPKKRTLAPEREREVITGQIGQMPTPKGG